MVETMNQAMHSRTPSVLCCLLFAGLIFGATAHSTERPKTANVCVIHLIGNPKHKGGEAKFKRVSFHCTGEKLPIPIRVHSSILDAVTDQKGVTLTTDDDVRGLIQFEDTLSLTILDSVFENLDCSGLTPVVFDRSAGLFYNCMFMGNTHCRIGAILAAGRSLMHVYDSQFINNAGASHGAVFTTGGVKTRFINTQFRGNEGGAVPDSQGFISGAFFSFQGTLAEFERCKFSHNVAKGAGAGAFTGVKRAIFKCTDCTLHGNSGLAGAVALTDLCTGTLIRTKMVNNKATGDGGAISLSIRSDITINGCQFESNHGLSGAILARDSKNVNVQNSDFHGNVGTKFGGAVSYVVAGHVVIQGCSGKNNTGKLGGFAYQDRVHGAVFKECIFSNNVGHLSGGAVYQKDCGNTEITKCEFVENDGGAVGGGISQTGCGAAEWMDASMQHMVECLPGDKAICKKISISGCKFKGNKASTHAASIYQGRCKKLYVTSTTFPDEEMSVVQERCRKRKFKGDKKSEASVYVKDCPKGTDNRKLMSLN